MKGARPGIAEPLVIVITDGFGQQDATSESKLLRRIIPKIYAVAVNHNVSLFFLIKNYNYLNLVSS